MKRVAPPTVGPDTIAVVSEALLPLLCWREVPVQREVRRELTRLERFVLEMGLRLGNVDGQEFEEILSLPARILPAVARRLVAAGAMKPQDGGYAIDKSVARVVLRRQALVQRHPLRLDLAFLPHTDDLIAVPTSNGQSWLRELTRRRARSAMSAPVDPSLWTRKRGEYVGERIRAGRVAGLAPDIIEGDSPDPDEPFVPDDEPDRGTVPAFRCRAEISGEPPQSLRVWLQLEPDSSSGRTARERHPREVTADLSNAEGLIERWLRLANALSESRSQHAAWQVLGPPIRGLNPAHVRRSGAMAWHFGVDGATAAALATDGRMLSAPMGLAIGDERETVELLAWLEPTDQQAEATFALDEAIGTLLTAEQPADELAKISGRGLTAKDIRRRAWQLGKFSLVYALREREDFAYA